MLISGKKFRASPDEKIKILTLVLSEKKILNETKNHNPALQGVDFAVLIIFILYQIFDIINGFWVITQNLQFYHMFYF